MRPLIYLCFLITLASSCHEPPNPTGPPENSVVRKLDSLQSTFKTFYKERMYDSALALATRGYQFAIANNLEDSAAAFISHKAKTFQALQVTDSIVPQYRVEERLATNSHATWLIAESQTQLAAGYYAAGEADSVDRYMGKIIKGIDTLKDGPVSMSLVTALSVIYATHNQPQKALDGFFKRLEYDRDAGDSAAIGVALMHVGRTYMQINDKSRALMYLRESIIYMKGTARVTALVLVGTRYAALGMYDSAVYSHTKAISIASGLSDSSHLYNAYLSFSESLVELGRFNEAETYLARSLQYFRRKQNVPSIIDINTIYASIEEKRGNNQAAVNYFKEALRPAQEGEYLDWVIFIYDELSKVTAKQGDYEAAFGYQRLYTAIVDSQNTEINRKTILELETKYKSSLKEQQILELQRKAQITGLQLQEKNRNQALLVGALIVVFLIAGLLYRNVVFRRRAGRLLNEKNVALRTANDAKIKLITIISHDLRAPVSSLFNLLETQSAEEKAGTTSPTLDRKLQLQESATRVLETMEDILVWSKSQLEAFKPTIEDVEIRELVTEVIGMYQAMASLRQVTLHETIADGWLRTDPYLLKTIIRNLLSNAISFSPIGATVEVGARVTNKGLELLIADHGPGITGEQQSNALEWFNVRSGTSGYGLGLARELTNKLEGELSIESSPAAGTLIRVCIPG